MIQRKWSHKKQNHKKLHDEMALMLKMEKDKVKAENRGGSLKQKTVERQIRVQKLRELIQKEQSLNSLNRDINDKLEVMRNIGKEVLVGKVAKGQASDQSMGGGKLKENKKKEKGKERGKTTGKENRAEGVGSVEKVRLPVIKQKRKIEIK